MRDYKPGASDALAHKGQARPVTDSVIRLCTPWVLHPPALASNPPKCKLLETRLTSKAAKTAKGGKMLQRALMRPQGSIKFILLLCASLIVLTGTAKPASAEYVRTPYYCADTGCSKYFKGAFWYNRYSTYVRLESVRFHGALGLENSSGQPTYECDWSHGVPPYSNNYTGAQSWARYSITVSDGNGSNGSTHSSLGGGTGDSPAGAVFDNCTRTSNSTYPTLQPYGPIQTHTQHYYKYSNLLAVARFRLYEGSGATLTLSVTHLVIEGNDL
jgi:hypothetical protein